MEVVLEQLRALRDDVAALRQEVLRYKGFVGGVAWALSIAAGGVGFLWGLLTKDGL